MEWVDRVERERDSAEDATRALASKLRSTTERAVKAEKALAALCSGVALKERESGVQLQLNRRGRLSSPTAPASITSCGPLDVGFCISNTSASQTF